MLAKGGDGGRLAGKRRGREGGERLINGLLAEGGCITGEKKISPDGGRRGALRATIWRCIAHGRLIGVVGRAVIVWPLLFNRPGMTRARASSLFALLSPRRIDIVNIDLLLGE